MPPQPAPPRSAALLSTWDTVSVIVGIVIGAGIYETPPLVFGNVPSATWGIAAWVIGGLLCLNGAFTYAELASTYPRSGGDYVYLTKAYGRWVGFLFGWAQLTVVLTANIGMMAYVFADYAARLWDFGSSTTLIYAVTAVIALSAMNIAGVALGKRVQNVLSTTKLVGLAAVIFAGLFLASPPNAVAAPPTAEAAGFSFQSIAFALVLIFITYGGWNDAAFFVAEMHEPRRVIRSLTLGVLVIAAVYVLVNMAYLHALGFEGAKQSNAIAVDTIQAAGGGGGAAQGVALLVMISALSALNGLIFASSRVFATVGEDHRVFALLGRRNPRLGTPAVALVVQALITLGLIALVGSQVGQQWLDRAFAAFGLPRVTWAGKGGFDTLLRCTAPVFWLFFLMTSVALFVLRVREPRAERPFTAPLFPFCPLLFTATCGYMLYSSLGYAGSLGWVGGALLAVGLPVYWGSRMVARTGPA